MNEELSQNTYHKAMMLTHGFKVKFPIPICKNKLYSERNDRNFQFPAKCIQLYKSIKLLSLVVTKLITSSPNGIQCFKCLVVVVSLMNDMPNQGLPLWSGPYDVSSANQCVS